MVEIAFAQTTAKWSADRHPPEVALYEARIVVDEDGDATDTHYLYRQSYRAHNGRWRSSGEWKRVKLNGAGDCAGFAELQELMDQDTEPEAGDNRRDDWEPVEILCGGLEDGRRYRLRRRQPLADGVEYFDLNFIKGKSFQLVRYDEGTFAGEGIEDGELEATTLRSIAETWELMKE